MSLAKCEVFGLIIQTHECFMPVGYKLIFIYKCHEKSEIARYMARLIA